MRTTFHRDAAGNKQLYKAKKSAAVRLSASQPVPATVDATLAGAPCATIAQQQLCTAIPQGDVRAEAGSGRRRHSTCKAQRARTLRAREQMRDAANSAYQLGQWLAAKANAGQQSQASPPHTASDRLEALRQRVRARALEAEAGC